MKLDDLIKHYEVLKLDNGDVNIDYVINNLKEFRILNKPCVDQFIADWYEEHKGDLEFNVWDWIAFRDEPKKTRNKKFNDWLNKGVNDPIQTLVKMHLFGYKVKEEKKYTVKITKTGQYLYCVDNDFTFVTYVRPDDNPRIYHTKKELNKAGFDDVFGNPMFDVKEVS